MTKRTRRNHSPAFKAKVALAAVKGEKTLAELAQQTGIGGGSAIYDNRGRFYYTGIVAKL